MFRRFLLLTFVRGISEIRHQRIWNQHKILRFFDTHIDIFQEKFFLGHNSTFWILKMQMRKKLYIFKHFAKSKKLLFCHYLSFSEWFQLKFQKKFKIEAPYSAVSLTSRQTRQNINSKRRLQRIQNVQEGKRHLAAFVFVPSVFGEKFSTAEFWIISAETSCWEIERKINNCLMRTVTCRSTFLCGWQYMHW